MKNKIRLKNITFHGYTHCFPMRLLWLWKLIFCRFVGWHLWDEVVCWQDQHYMVCDACEEILHIKEKRNG